MDKVILYSSHCPQCKNTEQMLKNNKIDFEMVDNEDIYFPIAEKNNIMSMPFAKINDNVIISGKYLFNYAKGENHNA